MVVSEYSEISNIEKYLQMAKKYIYDLCKLQNVYKQNKA